MFLLQRTFGQSNFTGSPAKPADRRPVSSVAVYPAAALDSLQSLALRFKIRLRVVVRGLKTGVPSQLRMMVTSTPAAAGVGAAADAGAGVTARGAGAEATCGVAWGCCLCPGRRSASNVAVPSIRSASR